VDIRKRWESREEQNQAREDGQLSGHTPHVTAPLEREMRHGDPLPLNAAHGPNRQESDRRPEGVLSC
jgi:hypothetical protein